MWFVELVFQMACIYGLYIGLAVIQVVLFTGFINLVGYVSAIVFG